MFKVHYCKARMVAFLNGELSPRSRRRMARFIDECDDCYTEYVRQREIQRNLNSDLRRIGSPDADVLSRILVDVKREVFAPRPSPARMSYQRYGLATVVVTLMLIFPLLVGQDQRTQSVATQPTPKFNVDQSATAPSSNIGAVAIATGVPRSQTPANLPDEQAPQVRPAQTPQASR